MKPPGDEFYIGWQDRAPASTGRRLRWVVAGLIGSALVLGAILSLGQRTIGPGGFEFGRLRSFSGVFVSRPYPHLLVPRPGGVAAPGVETNSTYYLVAPWKFGLPEALAKKWDGHAVQLQGTLIYRRSQTMVEVVLDSLRAATNAAPAAGTGPDFAGAGFALGRHTLVGEIVDSKCFLGVMNPGQLAPHRACAIRCISGGVPPVLVVRSAEGGVFYVLLVSAQGEPVNQAVLAYVAEPVAITGELSRHGEWLELRADPATIRRVSAAQP